MATNITQKDHVNQTAQTVLRSNVDKCNNTNIKIKSSFIDYWENIPETLILNITIGLILFIIFVLLTKIAWRRSDSSDQLKTQSIITFLYGYRDPEQWYVIPRLEFLRREDRHHKHDLHYPYIYVPPKLPLANPLELIAMGNQDKSRSVDSGHPFPHLKQPARPPVSPDTESSASRSIFSPGQVGPKSPEEKIKNLKISSKRSLDSVLSGQTSVRSPSLSASASASTLNQTINSFEPNTEKSATPGASEFYPSILTAEQLQASYLSRKLNKFFGSFLKVSDTDLIYARGIDAYEYLLFQRHLILIMFVTTILCCCVILPIHWFGSEFPRMGFQRTTIKNLYYNETKQDNITDNPYRPSENLHWAHIICSGVIVFTTLKVMNSYRESILTQDDPQISRRTLLVGNIPREQRTRVKLTTVFREYFPGITVEAIQFVYDCKSLIDDEMYLSSIIAAKDYCMAYKRKSNEEIYVHKTDVNQNRTCDGYCRFCSFVYICCCYWPLESREPGTIYYAREEENYRKKIAASCERLVKKPTEFAFITFKSYSQARKVISDLANMKQASIEGRRRLRSVSGSLRSIASDRAGHDREHRDATDGPINSKFFETSNSNPSKDPLHPSNNPHVRSIRSPIKGSTVPIEKSPVESAPSNEHTKDRLNKTPSDGKHDRGGSGTKATETTTAHKHHSKNKTPTRTSQKSAKSLKHANEHSKDKSHSRSLEGPIMWSVRYAPHPDNVEFDDLLNLTRTSKWTILLLHALMVIIFLFLTTPGVILQHMYKLLNNGTDGNNTNNNNDNNNSSANLPSDSNRSFWDDYGIKQLILGYSSTLLQIVLTAILPALVTLISKQIPYEDSSSKSHSIMWKVFAFLLLMVIVMPSISFESFRAFFEKPIKNECMFNGDYNGSWYINYVVSSIFLSNILELIKPIDIIYFYFIFWTSRSKAEFESGRQFIDREFSVGMQHTAVLLVFSVVITYCISVPLIAPAGLCYLCVKHAIDHYNLNYCYFTKKVDKDLQSTIVIFVKIALLLMLFQTTIAIWFNTNSGTSHFVLLALMIFWITLATVGCNCFFDCTARTLVISKSNRYNHEFCACFYLPKVISSLLRFDAIPSHCISRKV